MYAIPQFIKETHMGGDSYPHRNWTWEDFTRNFVDYHYGDGVISQSIKPKQDLEDVMITLKTVSGKTISIPQQNYESLDYDVKEITSWETGDGILHTICLEYDHRLYKDGWHYYQELDDFMISNTPEMVTIEEFDAAKAS